MYRKAFERIALYSSRKTERREAGNGILLERRRILWLPAAALAALLVPPSKTRAEPAPGFARPKETISWEDFIRDVAPTALELHADATGKGQDAYLFWLASMAARLDHATIPKAKLASFAALEPPVETGLAHRGKPFFIIEWKMSSGAYLPPHNHPNISVCTVCTGGRARIRNFDPPENAPEFSSKRGFEIRETHDEILTPGRINTLSAVRDNIHTFRAGPDGASGIDITTYHGPDEGFSFLDIDEKPSNAEERVFRAVWKKR